MKDKIIKEGKRGIKNDRSIQMVICNEFDFGSILAFVLPWSNPSGLILSIINLIAVTYFVIVVNYIKNNKKNFLIKL